MIDENISKFDNDNTNIISNEIEGYDSDISEHEREILYKGKTNINENENKTINLTNKNQSNNENINSDIVNDNKLEHIICIKDLDINESTKNFIYRSKSFYLYTPIHQINNCKIISWRCTIYRKNEKDNKGRHNKLCYGTITFNKVTKEIILKTKHSKYCDELKQTIPDNIEDIDSEIDKKDKIYNYMAKIYNNNLIYH